MKPTGNGLIEMVDEKSTDRGFFCMELVGFIFKDGSDYTERFAQAKRGQCAYKNVCRIYARTMTNRTKQPQQLMFNF